MAYSEKIKQVVEELFKESNWKYKTKELEEAYIFRAGLELDEDIKIPRIVFTVQVFETDVIISSVCDIKSDSNNINRMSEYIGRVNSGLKNGNFELDYEEGTIIYKVYIYVGERQVSKIEIAQAIVVSAEMWIRYGDGIVEVLGSNKEPKEIITRIESVEQE